MYVKNSRGPSTEPCGTPLKTSQGVEVQPPRTTICVRPVRKDVIQFKVFHQG